MSACCPTPLQVMCTLLVQDRGTAGVPGQCSSLSAYWSSNVPWCRRGISRPALLLSPWWNRWYLLLFCSSSWDLKTATFHWGAPRRAYEGVREASLPVLPWVEGYFCSKRLKPSKLSFLLVLGLFFSRIWTSETGGRRAVLDIRNPEEETLTGDETSSLVLRTVINRRWDLFPGSWELLT